MPTGTADIGNHCDDCTTTIPLPFAVSLYDRAYSTAAGIFTATTGTPGSRDFVVEWRTRYFGRGGQASFAVVFHEGTPVFDVYYGPSTESGSSATAGVQVDPTNYTEYSENQPNLTNGLRLTYAPCSITDSNDATPNNGVVQGTAGDDFLCGDSDPEVLRGEGGDDVLRGGGGADVLDGNAGADDMEGGAGTDRASYNGRVSALSVSIGAGTGDDGAAGEGDTVRGDVEDVRGGSGNDVLTGDDDANLLLGEGGDDDLFGEGGGDDLRGDSSNAQGGADEVHGGSGNGALRGYDGSDQHFGDDGNDTVYSDAGADSLSGGDGIDSAYYAARAGDLSVTVGAGLADDGGAGEGDDVQGDVEKVSGGTGNDHLTGNANPLGTVLLGGAGNDTLHGGGGPKDLLAGGAGNDDLDTQDGESSDTLSCGGGFDNWLADSGDTVKGDCEGGFL